MSRITVDFSKTLRKMKPMHGVDNGPWTCDFTADARPFYKEAGLPIARLHDTEYPFGCGEFVDLDCIFKNFNADENDPANYNFAMTDLYIQAIVECGTKVIYRLGCTIEHQPVKVHIGPPADYAKWARIAEHIIRHYNEGWANGYHWDLRYWEIWNEPNHAEQDRKMWGGSAEDFARFYDTVSTYLKKCFPDYKIGGPAFSNPESEFVHRFFTELTKDGNHPPMDFYSWHGYIDSVEESVRRAGAADKVLQQYGYFGIESIYDEWNYVKSWGDMATNYNVIQNQKGMALDVAVMCAMQSTSCTAACYYDAQLKFAGGWCGLFKRDFSKHRNGGSTGVVPKKPFYAFKAFNEVYRLGAMDTEAEIGTQRENIADQVQMEIEGEYLYGVAARSYDGKKGAILVSNYRDLELPQEPHEIHFNLKGFEGKKIHLNMVDEGHDLERIMTVPAGDFTFRLEPDCVLLAIIE